MTEKVKFGSTEISFTSWAVNPRQPEKERERHFQAVRRLVEELNLQVVELSLDFGLLHPHVMDAAFYRRVAALLLERVQVQNPVRITHQELANEIGSSREVVSRLLEDFSLREIVQLARGEIEVLDFERLKTYLVM